MAAEKETPFLFTDLIPPELVGKVKEETPKDVIPIRTWSRGSPYVIGGETIAGGGQGRTSAKKGEGATKGIFSPNGMINYSSLIQDVDQALQGGGEGGCDEAGRPIMADKEDEVHFGLDNEYDRVFDAGGDYHSGDEENDERAAYNNNTNIGKEDLSGEDKDEEEGEEEEGGEEEEEDYGAEYEEDDEEYHDDLEEFEGESGEDKKETGIREHRDGDQDENDDNDGLLPNYDDFPYTNDTSDDAPGGGGFAPKKEFSTAAASSSTSMKKDKQARDDSFEPVALSQDELNLIAAGSPGEDYDDLLNIMNEYNDLVNCLQSPRASGAGANPTATAANVGKKQSKQKIKKKVAAGGGGRGKKEATTTQQFLYTDVDSGQHDHDDGDAAAEADDDDYDDNYGSGKHGNSYFQQHGSTGAGSNGNSTHSIDTKIQYEDPADDVDAANSPYDEFHNAGSGDSGDSGDEIFIDKQKVVGSQKQGHAVRKQSSQKALTRRRFDMPSKAPSKKAAIGTAQQPVGAPLHSQLAAAPARMIPARRYNRSRSKDEDEEDDDDGGGSGEESDNDGDDGRQGGKGTGAQQPRRDSSKAPQGGGVKKKKHKPIKPLDPPPAVLQKLKHVKSSGLSNNTAPQRKKTKEEAREEQRIAKAKQRAALAAIAEKRRQEEEELEREAERAHARRKKFKEALLEKALKAREESAQEDGAAAEEARRLEEQEQAEATAAALKKKRRKQKAAQKNTVESGHGTSTTGGGGSGSGDVPGFLAPTKAFQVQSKAPAQPKTSSKTAHEVILTEADLTRQEEEKREKVAALRRKFKEQHKKILAALANKNKDEEQKLEEERKLSELRKEKHRLKAAKLLAVKQQQYEQEQAANGDGGTVDANNGSKASDETDPIVAARLAAVAATSGGAIDYPGPVIKKTQSAQEKRRAPPVGAGASQRASSSRDNSDNESVGSSVAGSALAAVRRRSRSYSQPTTASSGSAADPTSTSTSTSTAAAADSTSIGRIGRRKMVGKKSSAPVAAGDPAGAIDASGLECVQEGLTQEQQQRRQASKEQQAKVESYLSQLAEQKRREEEEKRRKEERSKRRMNLLSQRLLQEAAERKLMAQHDHPRHASSTSGSGPGSSAANAGAGRVSKAKDDKSGAGGRSSSSKRASEGRTGKPPPNPSSNSTSASASGASRLPPSTNDCGLDRSRDYNFEATKTAKKPKITQEMANNHLASRMRASQQGGESPSSSIEVDKESSSAGGGGSSSTSVITAGVSTVPVRDFADWKRKNNVPPDGLVFAMTGWYPCVRQALLDRGWYYNPDVTSQYFNLKWTLRSIDIAPDSLQPWQLTNHYAKNVAITTKAGLLKSLRSLVWLADVDTNTIFPRGYDLSIPEEMQAFIDDFRCQKAEGILKRLYLAATGIEHPLLGNKTREQAAVEAVAAAKAAATDATTTVTAATEKTISATDTTDGADQDGDSDASGEKRNSMNPNQAEEDSGMEAAVEFALPPVPAVPSDVSLGDIKVNQAVFETACRILEKQIQPYDDNYIDQQGGAGSNSGGSCDPPPKLVTDLEWEILNLYGDLDTLAPVSGPTDKDAVAALEARLTALTLPCDTPEPVDGFLREKEDPSAKLNAEMQRAKRNQQRQEQKLREAAAREMEIVRGLTQQDVDRLHFILCTLMHHNSTQSGLNGFGKACNNMWIVKPAAKSRGRGITTFTDLPKLLKYVDAGLGRYNSQWIVQKYMENPMVIAKRKFDLRQWVLVTNWNPLTIYFYDECYARFSVEEYSTESGDLDNAFVHLVNNSIGKNSDKFYDKITAENGDQLNGYMMSFEQMCSYISHKSGSDLMRSKIQPRMKDIAKWSLMCASEMIEHRKNSWELYGFDFMVDDEYNAWLIEINSSPACDYSTTVTERYVQKALVELLKVVLDCREWEALPKKARTDPYPDTGGWEKIYQGPLLDMPSGAFGTDMTVKGDGYKAHPRGGSLPINQVKIGELGKSVRNLYNRPTASTLASAAAAAAQQRRKRSGLATDGDGDSDGGGGDDGDDNDDDDDDDDIDYATGKSTRDLGAVSGSAITPHPPQQARGAAAPAVGSAAGKPQISRAASVTAKLAAGAASPVRKPPAIAKSSGGSGGGSGGRSSSALSRAGASIIGGSNSNLTAPAGGGSGSPGDQGNFDDSDDDGQQLDQHNSKGQGLGQGFGRGLSIGGMSIHKTPSRDLGPQGTAHIGASGKQLASSGAAATAPAGNAIPIKMFKVDF